VSRTISAQEREGDSWQLQVPIVCAAPTCVPARHRLATTTVSSSFVVEDAERVAEASEAREHAEVEKRAASLQASSSGHLFHASKAADRGLRYEDAPPQ